MRINSRVALFAAVGCLVLTQLQKAFASSNVTVTITEKPLAIVSVTAPTFGSYQLSEEGTSVEATGDLVIQVKDVRQNRDSPWSLQYQLTTFFNDTDYEVRLDFGQGSLTNEAAEALTYVSYGIEVANNQRGELVNAYSNSGENYEFRIAKEDIHLILPENAPIGQYRATQTVSLINTADPQ